MSLEFMLGCMAMVCSLTSALPVDIHDGQAPHFCDSLGCANNATCRTTLTDNEIEGRHVTYSECLCHNHWIGPKCDHRLSLNILHHHGDIAELKTDVLWHGEKSRGLGRDTRSKMDDSDLRFKVQYWTNHTGAMCSIMARVRDRQFQIKGLKGSTFYSVCVSALEVDLCFVKSHQTLALMPNCVLFKTLDGNETVPGEVTEGNSRVVAPLSLSIFFVIVLVIIIVILVKCKKTRQFERIRPTLQEWRSSVRCCACPCLTDNSAANVMQSQNDLWLIPGTSNGRFGRGRHGHTRGTGIPLTTIIEYKTEEAETSASPLMEPQQPDENG